VIAAVVALGKIGLPLAVQFARSGVRTYGADIDGRAVATIASGTPPFPGEAHLEEYLPDALDSGQLTVGTDTTAAVRESDVVVVVVPLLVDVEGAPIFTAMDAATADIAKGLRPGTLVIYETTLPFGTTRNRFEPMLAELSGLDVSEFLVAHSPERVYSGRVFADFAKYPKLVGGTSDEAARRCVEFYEAVLDFDVRDDLGKDNGVWDLGSAEAAEFAKLAGTTYRDVNIALANEFARFAESNGVDIGRVIEASNSQPFSHVLKPGIWVGGHCIPVYPRFYTSVDVDATLPVTAREVNTAVPKRVVKRMADLMDGLNGKSIVVLGAAYRGGVMETAVSGVFPVVAALQDAGADVRVHDPLYSDQDLEALGFAPYAFGEACDGAVLQSDHDEYRSIGPSDLPGISLMYDGRAWLDPSAWSAVTYLRIGVG